MYNFFQSSTLFKNAIGPFILGAILLCFSQDLKAQHSVARQWNEVLLEAIRRDFARPTVHARNLFHISAAMYDAWAFFDEEASTYLLGKTVNGFGCAAPDFTSNQSNANTQKEAMSHAVSLLLRHRFQASQGSARTERNANELLNELGYDRFAADQPLVSGEPAALGAYIAQCYIDYGLQDGSNEVMGYANLYYENSNPSLFPTIPGNPTLEDRNRYQRLTLSRFIDQSGNGFSDTPDFLSPEWGNVHPFSLTDEDRVTYERDGNTYQVYEDPGPPPYWNDFENGLSEEYLWGFGLVSIWGSHLDPADGVMWDISPASIGNNPEYPTDFKDYREFYNTLDGGDASRGHTVNPVTGEPYPPNIVPRGDYARVLAEFWADGPDSETPPGHWFTLLNYVRDHPLSTTKYRGEGPDLDPLEYDVKAYFLMGGAMHDAAVAAWSVKGYYDYIRPISAIRGTAELGQRASQNLLHYNENAFDEVPGLIEVIRQGDPLLLEHPTQLNRLKMYTWRGPEFIDFPETDLAGVGWIPAFEWWPYQRPTFVTPPFAGYVSGHSTFSRAAAEVMTLLTGDAFFPGGVGEFVAERNEFLVFEEGPSVDITLQWATYNDASDQTSLSRIWGGIHPPADDIPGRVMGQRIGKKAFNFANLFFEGQVPNDFGKNNPGINASPNPVTRGEDLTITIFREVEDYEFRLTNSNGTEITDVRISDEDNKLTLDTSGMRAGIYLLRIKASAWSRTVRFIVN